MRRTWAILRLNPAKNKIALEKTSCDLMWLPWSVCSDVLHKQRGLFSEDVAENLLRILPDMKQSAHAYLLKPVHEVLKVSLVTSDFKTKLTLNVSANNYCVCIKAWYTVASSSLVVVYIGSVPRTPSCCHKFTRAPNVDSQNIPNKCKFPPVWVAF